VNLMLNPGKSDGAFSLTQNALNQCPECRTGRGRGIRRLLKLLRGALLIAVLILDICLSAKAIPALWSVFHERSQPTPVPLMNIKFDSLPDQMTVRVFLVAQKNQRYDTLGDWIWTETGLDIRLSREFAQQDPRYGALLLVHEFVEAMLCRITGVSTRQVDTFDMSFTGDSEPGDDPSAPYHRQHRAAEAA
jgi:hypothetical protein